MKRGIQQCKELKVNDITNHLERSIKKKNMGLIDFLKRTTTKAAPKEVNSKGSEWDIPKVENKIDQRLLTELVKMDATNRREAVRELDKTHQKLFTYIVENDTDEGVCEQAVWKLDKAHQELFAYIAENDTRACVRRATIIKLDKTHQKLFAYIAENDSDEDARYLAIEKLDATYQALFAFIAKEDETDYRKAGKKAVAKLTDEELLADIAINDNKIMYFRDAYDSNKITTLHNYDLGEIAVKKLTERRLLAKVARKAKNPNVQKLAEEKLDTID